MNSETKVLKLFNKIFWIIIVVILLSELYQFLEPKIIGIHKDKNLVADSDIINELADCSTNYFDAINYKQYERANMLNSYLNRKTDDEYNKIYDKINTDSAYKIIVKYAYKLVDETYRCYVLVQDLSKGTQDFIGNNDKSTMHELIIKLDLDSVTFKILYDKFI